jgi:hypothetical protein
VTGPLPRADGVREPRHPIEDSVDLGHDVRAVDHDRGPGWGAQRNVEDGAVLRDVDVLAGEHRADALTETGLLGKLDQEAQRVEAEGLFLDYSKNRVTDETVMRAPRSGSAANSSRRCIVAMRL